MMNIYGEYFYGNKISDYGLEHGFVDYGTLAKAFDAVLNNDIMQQTECAGLGYWEIESGMINNSDAIEELEGQIEELEEKISALEDEQGETKDDALYDELAEKIEALENKRDDLENKKDDLEYENDDFPECFQFFIVSDSGADILREANEPLWYNETLDIYVWGVTHYGTSWSYVLTDIPCNTGEI